jgi:hypothetical protein
MFIMDWNGWDERFMFMDVYGLVMDWLWIGYG